MRGFGGMYEASSLGRVRSKARSVTKRTRHGGEMVQAYAARVLQPSVEKGYLRVHLGVNGAKRKAWVHTMVLHAFDRCPNDGEVCRHLNGIRHDNRPENLAWGSHLENMADRKAHGAYALGEDHVMAKLTAAQVEVIRTSEMTGRAASQMFGISESQVSRIRRGTNWRDSE